MHQHFGRVYLFSFISRCYTLGIWAFWAIICSFIMRHAA
jgi:hypothetical protein